MKNSNLVTKVLEGVMNSLENSSIHCPNCKTHFPFKKDLLEPGQFLQLWPIMAIRPKLKEIIF